MPRALSEREAQIRKTTINLFKFEAVFDKKNTVYSSTIFHTFIFVFVSRWIRFVSLQSFSAIAKENQEVRESFTAITFNNSLKRQNRLQTIGNPYPSLAVKGPNQNIRELFKMYLSLPSKYFSEGIKLKISSRYAFVSSGVLLLSVCISQLNKSRHLRFSSFCCKKKGKAFNTRQPWNSKRVAVPSTFVEVAFQRKTTYQRLQGLKLLDFVTT